MKKKKIQSFSLYIDLIDKLDDISRKEGISRSEVVCNLISNYNFISLDVQKEQSEIEKELFFHKEKLKDLEERKSKLMIIYKQKNNLDKLMASKREEFVKRIANVLTNGGNYEGMDSIAKIGQSETGIDARELITEAIGRIKK